MSAIDHAAKAEELAAGELKSGSFDQTRDYIALAQVHATLALVEQQRIANLIALGQFRIGVEDLPHFRHLVSEAKDEFDVQPTATIREGLGL